MLSTLSITQSKPSAPCTLVALCLHPLLACSILPSSMHIFTPCLSSTCTTAYDLDIPISHCCCSHACVARHMCVRHLACACESGLSSVYTQVLNTYTWVSKAGASIVIRKCTNFFSWLVQACTSPKS